MKNAYYTGYFPLISILLFSLSSAIYTELIILEFLKKIGLYIGLLEFFSVTGIKLTLLFIIFLLFFMLFSALKLLMDATLQVSLLFFSKEYEGESLKNVRLGSVIYLIGASVSILFTSSIMAIALIFIVTTLIAFIYFIYKASENWSTLGLVGMVFFHVLFWSVFTASIGYSVIKLYNSLLASLPV